MIISGNNERLHWIDCMKAFAMLLVVYRHVYGFTFDCSPYASSSLIGRIFPLLAMPLFFFISGFLAYKPKSFWSTSATWVKRIKQKTIQLLIPTILFSFLLNEFVINLNFPGGYWFTLVLFEIFILFYTFEYLTRNMNNLWHDILLVIIAMSAFLMKQKIANLSIPYCSLGNLCEYLIYFVVGVLLSKQKQLFTQTLENKLITLIGGVILLGIFLLEVPPGGFLYTFSIQIKRCLLIFLTTAIFYSQRYFFQSDHLAAKALRYIGNKTLDLYMLHYFFLWPSIPAITDILASNNNFPLELLLTATWTIIVVILVFVFRFCLISNRLISKYLLGNYRIS